MALSKNNSQTAVKMFASGPTVMNRINRYGGMLGRPANLIKMSLGFGG